MLFKKSLTVAGLAGLAQATPRSLRARDHGHDECPAGHPSTVYQHHVSVVTYPVVINQFFDHNTIININGGVTININNAPTSVSSTVTVTTTTTSTSTM
jgi:hypothetical protein